MAMGHPPSQLGHPPSPMAVEPMVREHDCAQGLLQVKALIDSQATLDTNKVLNAKLEALAEQQERDAQHSRVLCAGLEVQKAKCTSLEAHEEERRERTESALER